MLREAFMDIEQTTNTTPRPSEGDHEEKSSSSAVDVEKEMQAHNRALERLVALRRFVHDRQHNKAYLAGMNNVSLARSYCGVTYKYSIGPALRVMADMRSALKGGAKQNVIGFLGVLMAIIFGAPVVLLPLLLVAVAFLAIYPLIALMFVTLLFLTAESTTALVSVVLTVNWILPIALYMLRCVTFKGEQQAEPEALAQALKESYDRSGLLKTPCGFLGQWDKYIARPFTTRPLNQPQDAVINIYTWRALKAYGMFWHAFSGALIIALAFVYRTELRFCAPAAGQGGGEGYTCHPAVWVYPGVWLASMVGIAMQLFEEQVALFDTANPFEEKLYDRLSTMWRDLGRFSVNYKGGRRKLRDAVQEFAKTEEQRSADALERFNGNQLNTGRPADAALGIFPYLGVPDQQIWAGMSKGVAAIEDEFKRHGNEADLECLYYCLHQPAGSSPKTFQHGLLRDCDPQGNLLPERRRVEDGEPMTFHDFVHHERSKMAHLLDAHVLALRVYTTAAFRTINNPLRSGTKPHPLPITVAFLTDGVRRLRAVFASRAEGHVQSDFWRGMRNVELDEAAPHGFLAVGGTEQAPMSTTKDFEVALNYSANSESRLLFKVSTNGFMEQGADVQYLSAFPAEAEFLYPPLTYLRPTGEKERVEVQREHGSSATFTVIEVAPSFAS